MHFSGPTQNSVALAVWTNATRTLTSILNALQPSSSQQQTIAAGATVNLIPSSNTFVLTLLMINAGAAGSTSVFGYDGTSQYSYATVNAGASATLPCIVSTHVVYIRMVNNDVANAATYSVGQILGS